MDKRERSEMNENVVNLKKLMSDESKVRELLTIEKPEDAQAWFLDHGVNISMEEIMGIGDYIKKALNGEISKDYLDNMESLELSDDDLENASGGAWTTADTVATVASAVAGLGLGTLQILIGLGLIW